MTGDIASNLVAGVDRFLLRELDRSNDRRAKHWRRDFASPEAYAKSLEPNRQRLAHILGVRDKRPERVRLEILSALGENPAVLDALSYSVYAVRWRAFGDVDGEGLLLEPFRRRYPPSNAARGQQEGRSSTADALLSIVAIPDADVTPEQLADRKSVV